jgi:hypothetical protein
MVTRKSPDTPFLGRPDTLKVTVTEHPFSFPDSADKRLSALVVEAVNRMGGFGDNAEDDYQQAIEGLRARGDDVLDVIVAAYEALPEDRYLDRWSLVQLMAELRHPGAVKALNRIIGSRIPAEQAKGLHNASTVAEEVMIRTTAVEAVVRLSADGVEEAGAVLLRHAKSRTFSIRRACVQGVLETGTDQDKRQLRAILKERGDQDLLKVKRMDVREVPQATGGRFVVNPSVKDDPPPYDLTLEED